MSSAKKIKKTGFIYYISKGTDNPKIFAKLTADGRESINPINWKRDDTERGVVVVTTVDPAKYAIPENGWSLFGPECYHV